MCLSEKGAAYIACRVLATLCYGLLGVTSRYFCSENQRNTLELNQRSIQDPRSDPALRIQDPCPLDVLAHAGDCQGLASSASLHVCCRWTLNPTVSPKA